MPTKEKALEIVTRNGKKMAAELLAEVIKPALLKVVQDSSNPYDDILYAATNEQIEKAILDAIEKL